jgi:hypothetical protein
MGANFFCRRENPFKKTALRGRKVRGRIVLTPCQRVSPMPRFRRKGSSPCKRDWWRWRSIGASSRPLRLGWRSSTWDRFHEAPLRPKTLQTQISDKFTSENDNYEFTRGLWTIIFNFTEFWNHNDLKSYLLLKLTKLGFICKVRSKRIHEIDSSSLPSKDPPTCHDWRPPEPRPATTCSNK